MEYFGMYNNQLMTMIHASEKQKSGLHLFFQIVLMLIFAALLSACGNETENTENARKQTNNEKYSGPAPETTDIQNFKREFWAKLNDTENCGGCHIEGGQGTGKFVRTDNVNLAYAEALSIINVNDIPASPIVTKLANGHQCWLGSDQDCADAVVGYIQAWQQTATNSSTQIQLVAPVLKDAGATKTFPVSSASFGSIIHTPLLKAHCAGCHDDTSATPQAPFFSNTDVDISYEAAKAKLDLDTPANSRLVVRLREEFHNCWTSDCQADAQDMEDAIQQFANNISPTPIDPSLIISKAMQLGDAMIASSGIRYEDDVIALYEFKQGSGNIAFDTSGVSPALPLTLNGGISWVLGFGIEILNGGKAQGSVANSKKLSDFIKASGEYAIEAWVVPGNIVQNGRSIVTYSGGGNTRNFTMGQSQYNYDFKNRNNSAGLTTLSTADADEDLQAALQHVVMNFSPVAGKPSLGTAPLGRSIYVNGNFTGSIDDNGTPNDDSDDTYIGDVDDPTDPDTGGLLTSWNDTFAFALGNEPGGGANTLWKGKIRLLAIHSRALTQEQIRQNLNVGVGQKYFMLFSIADRINVPDSYIMFQVEQFDNTSYLFNKPTFVNLNPGYRPASSIVIKGLRIGINSKEAVAGQAFGNMDVVVADTSAYITDVGQQLSNNGTIISVEKGPGSDEFFLSFEQLGSATNTLVEPVPSPRVYPADPAENISSDIGVRTFDEINATLSAITGIPENNADVAATFSIYRQQLPSVENINAFLASHQMAVAQMAMKYCDVLVNTDKAYFSGFDFTATAGTAFNSDAKKNQILDPLLTALMNIDLPTGTKNLLTQPVESEIRNSIASAATQDLDPSLTGDSYSSLLTSMTQCLPGCNTQARTEEIVKAMCAATVGSAIMILQ